MPSQEALQGYILEEVITFLIRNAGYTPLVDPSQDPRELRWARNSLVVVGRGAVHQVDALGQMDWIPSFTFPVRLFAEGKFREKPTGLGAVRNAVGTVLDINQNYYPLIMRTGEVHSFHPRYAYAYALFSTSGFTKQATRMALAHQISLVDLGGREFARLRAEIQNAAAQHRGATYTHPVARIRHQIRLALGTLPQDLPQDCEYYRRLEQVADHPVNVDALQQAARQYRELFIGMANGPFMLVMSADDPASFLDYVGERPSHEVTITWNPDIEEGRRWEIRPAHAYGERKYRLVFRLPRLLAQWVFESSAESRRRALNVKQQLFSSITIYRRTGDQDSLFRLNYSAEDTLRPVRNPTGGWRV